MTWNIEFYPHAEATYRSLDPEHRIRVRDALNNLAATQDPPQATGVIRLRGRFRHIFSLRVNDTRIYFEILEDRMTLAVHLIIPHRRGPGEPVRFKRRMPFGGAQRGSLRLP